MKKLFTLTCLLFCSLSAKEYIENFDSIIRVNANGSMDVAETITYVNTDKWGLHGIVREFPTRYKGPYGTEYTVRFDVNTIERDGQEVPFHIKYEYEGARIYIGSKNIVVPPGKYTYTITYHTNRQLGFDQEEDILYWNVTGNGWPLPIHNVTATVILPDSIPLNQLYYTAYTGGPGARGKSFTSSINGHTILFKSTRQFSPYINHYGGYVSHGEGLTVFVSWPKGFIARPTQWQEFWFFAYDNRGLLLILVAYLIMLCCYIFLYRKIRAQESAEPVIPLFYPPKNMPPGATRYFLKQCYDARQFAAEIVNLAVHGFITIDLKKGLWRGTYTLKQTKKIDDDDSFWTVLRSKIMLLLFAGQSSVKLDSSNQTILQAAAFAIEQSYQKAYKGNYYFVSSYVSSLIPAVPMAIAILVAFIGQPYLSELWYIWVILVTVLFTFIGAVHYLKSYTIQGCKIRNQILGFKMFLAATETERLTIIGTPPTRTPELYETYLPYAIALGVEKQWSQQFASVFATLEKTDKAFYPVWYSGSGSLSSFSAASFSSQISNSLQSAARSSGAGGFGSGGSGGGSSGGGRGGGGGGSW